MACTPLVQESQRALVVRPSSNDTQEFIAPINEELDELDGDCEEAEVEDKWEALARTYNNLGKKIYEYLDEDSNVQATQPTPLQQNIATLETPRANVTAIILAGIIQKRPRTPDINLISESSDINYKGNGLFL